MLNVNVKYKMEIIIIIVQKQNNYKQSEFQIIRGKQKLAHFTNPMSTNSNQIDQLMQQNPTKQTKLQKFLKTIDQQTTKYIKNYLSTHDNPSNQTNTNTKPDKIKLYQDLLIIQRFKQNQKNIGNKKKIDQLCQELKNQVNFSIATIRQRIQKKLPNVSKEEILDHIKLQINFAFNTKRKLVPVKQIHKNVNDINQQSFLQLDQQYRSRSDKLSQHSKQSKPISISSSIQQSDSVQQIAQPNHQTKSVSRVYDSNNVRSLKKSIQKQQLCVFVPEVQQQKQVSNQSKKDKKEIQSQLYNQFRVGSDNQSDEQLLIIKNKDSFKMTTNKAQKQLEQIINIMRQQLLLIKNPPPPISNDLNQPKNQQSQQSLPLIDPQTNNIQQSHYNNQQNPYQQPIYQQSQQKQYQFQQQQQQHQIQQIQQPLPPQQQLYCYNSLQDWKLSNQNKQFEYLKWYPDEDQFLQQIICSQSMQKSVKLFQVLKKFKTQDNVLGRMKFFGMEVPEFIREIL